MKKLLALLLVLALCFTCFAACKGKVDEKPVENSKPTAVVYDVEDAAAYLKNMYKKYLVETETAADYTLVSQVMVGGVVYKVTWTTDRDDIKVIEDAENKQVKIDLNEKTKVDIKYTLTATVTDPDGKTKTLTFELKVPKYVLSSWKEYMAMEAGKAVVIEGYVAAIHSQSEGQKYNMLYVHDVNNAGGYYIYSMTADPIKDLNLKRGMLVSVTGTKDIYSGTHEIKDASVNVLDTKVVNFAPVDITSTYKEANSLSDEALVSKLGMYVTIKGVEITDQDLAEKSQYYNFKLAGLTSYIRLYRTDCPCSVSDADMKAIADGHTAKKGYYADVSGIVVLYNGSIYLNPISKDCFKYGAFIKRTDAEKVEVEMDEIKFDKDVPINKTLNLPSKGKSYENVVITWKSDSDAIEIKDGKAYIKLQAEATTASMTATFTLGAITKTKTYTFNLAKKPSVVAQQVTNPVANTAYKLYMVQLNRGETLYFTGEMNGHYGASTTDYNEAVDVYVETTNNGYFMYFNKGGEKNYINIVPNGTYINFVFQTDKPSAPFAVEATTGAPTLKIGDTTYYIATYNNYNTFGTTKYPDSSFLGYLGTMVDTTKISDADKVAKEKEALSISATNFSTDSSIDLKGAGTTYDDVKITWASNNACAVVADGKLNVTLQETAQTVTLTATLTCGTVTATKTFNITVDAKPSVVPVVVDTPVAGTAYKLYLVQGNLMNKGLYFIGTSANEVHFLSTSDDYTQGVDMFVEIPEAGKYYLYFMDGTAKKYITVKADAEGRVRCLIVAEADKGTAFTWNAEYKTFYMLQLEDSKYGLNDWYFGTYDNFETISASRTSYISTSFPVHLVTMVDTSSITDADKVAAEKDSLALEDEFFTDAEIDLTVKGVTYEDVTITWASNNAAAVVNNGKLTITPGAEDVTATITATITCGNVTETKTFEILIHKVVNIPYEVGKEYLFGMVHGGLENKTLYFKGEMHSNGYQFTSTEAVDSAVKVILEEDGTGYQIYFMNGTTKTYITIVPSGTYNNPTFSTTKPATPWNYDSILGTFTIVSGSKTYFLGTRNDRTEDTFSSCETKYTSNFKAVLMPATPAPYKLNTEYVMQLNHTNLNKLLYLSGNMDSFYYGTVEDATTAAKVIVEIDGQGYQISFVKDTVKTYLTIVKNGTHTNAVFVTEKPEATWDWDATLGTFTFTLGEDGTYFLGTNNTGTYRTFSPNKVSNTAFCKATLVDPATIGTGDGEGGNEPLYATPSEIVNALYALESGATLEGGPYTLTGIITNVNDAYSTTYGNITVTIVVEDLSDKPVVCYRIKGTGADTIAVGDTITVTGNLTNYNGTYEFTTGSSLDSYKTDAAIVDELYALESGAKLDKKYALTGVIASVDEAYSTQYSNVTVTIDVDGVTGKPVKCYRIKGTNAADLKVGDTITVYGELTNFSGTYEFTSGSKIIGYVAAPVIPDGGEGGEGGTSNASTATSFSSTTFNVTNNTAYGSYTSSDNWTTQNCQVVKPDTNNNTLAVDAVVLNGKTGAQGVLTSCLYANGIKSLSFKYGYSYTESKGFDLAIRIKNSEGQVVAQTTLTSPNLTKGQDYDYTWNLNTAVSGDFTIEFANLGTESSNKLRVAIWDIAWVNNN